MLELLPFLLLIISCSDSSSVMLKTEAGKASGTLLVVSCNSCPTSIPSMDPDGIL